MQTSPLPLTSAADFRAAIARYQLRVYHLASLVGVHPSRLSLMLNERRPFPPDLAEKLTRVIEDEARPA